MQKRESIFPIHAFYNRKLDNVGKPMEIIEVKNES